MGGHRGGSPPLSWGTDEGGARDKTGRSRLLRAAEPVIAEVAADLSGGSFVVVVADQRGHILAEALSDPALETPPLATEAIEGALAARELVVVTCNDPAAPQGGPSVAAAPIRDPHTAAVLGAVAILAAENPGRHGTAALVRQVAATVERRVADLGDQAQKDLLHAYLRATRDTTDPVLAVSSDALHAAPHTMRILGGLAHVDLWPVLEDSLAHKDTDEVTFHRTDGASVRLRVRALRRADQLVGAIGEVSRHPRTLPRPEGPVLPVPEYAGWSLAARRAAVTIRAAAQDLTPVCVAGEPGVGKRTMLRNVAGRVFPGRTLLLLDPAEARAARVSDELRGGTQVVVPHVEALSTERMERLVEIAHSPSATGWLAFTSRADIQELPEVLRGARVRTVHLPPLRARAQDIEQVLPVLLRRHAGKRDVVLSPALVERLRREAWPTNLHAIDQLIAELVRTADSRVIGVDHLPVAFGRMMRRRLTPMEWLTRAAILEALEANQGNKALAAQSVGMSRASIYRKIRDLGIEQQLGTGTEPEADDSDEPEQVG